MNRSKEYILNRILKDKNLNFEEFQNATVWEFNEKICNIAFNKNDFYNYFTNTLFSFESRNKYFNVFFHKANEDVKFQYYTHDFSQHDGTLLFLQEGIERTLSRLLHPFDTYPIEKKNECLNPWNKTFHWYIGDFIINLQHSPSTAPLDKKWMTERQEILLPLRLEVESN